MFVRTLCVLLAVGLCGAFSTGQDIRLDAVSVFSEPESASGRASVFAVTTDAAGHAYITGEFDGSIDFNPGPGSEIVRGNLPNTAFVAKLDARHHLVWVRTFKGSPVSSSSASHAVALDTGGSVYIAGRFTDTIDFDPGPGVFELTSAGGDDIFVCKLDTHGAFVWAVRAGATLGDAAQGIAVDDAGNVHVTGYARGTVDFDPGPGTAPRTAAGQEDAFVWKLSTHGEFLSAQTFGGAAFDRGYGIAVDAEGSTYTIGDFQRTADFDPGPGEALLTAAGSQNPSFHTEDIFITKLDATGAYQWAWRMGAVQVDHGRGIAIAPTGEILVTGSYRLNTALGPHLLGGERYTEVFVAKLRADGEVLWAESVRGQGHDIGMAVATDSAGNVYTTGYFDLSPDFDPDGDGFVLEAIGAYDAFVQKRSPDGDLLWAGSFSGPGDVLGRGIAVGRRGEIHVTGSFTGTADFDPGPEQMEGSSVSTYGMFLVRLKQGEDAAVTGDISGDEWVDAVDVQLAINAALGIAIGDFDGDVNGDGQVNAVDVQLVINAALGIG